MARRTILIIDDTPDHRDILRRLLQSVGYRVVVVSPGDEAVHSAQRERPDLIVAALSLPGQLAWETARKLRAHPSLATTPIIGTTVYSTLLNPTRVRAIGFADYVEKPFNTDELLYRIGRLMPDAPHHAYVA